MPKNFDMKGFEQLGNDLQKLRDSVPKAEDSIAKGLAARLLAKVTKETPVGDYSEEIEVTAKRNSKKHNKGDVYTKKIYPNGKKGGTLRRGWTSKTHEEAVNGKGRGTRADTYLDAVPVHHFGDKTVIEILNPVEYAPYVEYGHVTRGKNNKHWVKGYFMLTKSLKELEKTAPKVIEKKVDKMMKDTFK